MFGGLALVLACSSLSGALHVQTSRCFIMSNVFEKICIYYDYMKPEKPCKFYSKRNNWWVNTQAKNLRWSTFIHNACRRDSASDESFPLLTVAHDRPDGSHCGPPSPPSTFLHCRTSICKVCSYARQRCWSGGNLPGNGPKVFYQLDLLDNLCKKMSRCS